MSDPIPHSPDPAIRAATETVCAFGLEPDRCDILQNGHTVVLRLTESLVARVVAQADGARAGTGWFARETALARHLTRQGAPVIPLHPDMPDEPVTHLGLTMNFWEYVQPTDAKPGLADGARFLLDCHRILSGFPEPLPRLAILTESRELLLSLTGRGHFTAAHEKMLLTVLNGSRAVLENAPHQPLHGDAHPGNLMATTRGLLWTDWEDAFAGPPEWDLASLVWNALLSDGASGRSEADEAIAAWGEAGGPFDSVLFRHCLAARAAVMTAWYPVLYPNPGPERLAKLRFRLDWLEQHHPL